MEKFILFLLIGLILGKILSPIVVYYLDSLFMWYKNKYGKYTPAEKGKNYLQIFHKEIN